MTIATALRWIARESRGSRGRWLFFIACLALGVAAVTTVAGLVAGVEDGLRGEARQLLAADLAVGGQRPLPPALAEELRQRRGLEIADVREMVTVVAAPASDAGPGRSQLVELKAVADGYPFYGTLDLAPPRPLAELLGQGGAVVAPDLLARLDLAVGDPLHIGGVEFRVVGTVSREPDRVGTLFALGPRVLVSLSGLARTELEQFGSRITYRTLIRLPTDTRPEETEALATELRQRLADAGSYEVESHAEGQPGLRQGLRRVERFLGLVALLSLFVGGIGVAQTARAWLADRLDAIAILSCLGVRPREIFLLHLAQVVMLAVAGSLVGAIAGQIILLLAPRLLAGLLPIASFSAWQPLAALRGLGLGLGVALLFCLPPLLAAGRVPPVRVLRRDAEPLPVSLGIRLSLTMALIAGIWGVAAVQSGSARLGGQFALGVGAVAAVLAIASWAVVRAVRTLPRPRSLPLRYGLAALARPGAATLGAITALGLGVLVVLGMSLIESQLSRSLTQNLPTDAPSAFLIDIQPRQWEALRSLLEDEGVQSIDSVPVVSARLSAVDGRTVSEMVATETDNDPSQSGEPQDTDRRWAFTREQRLTTLDTLPEDNKIIAGALWSDPQQPEVSVERDFANELEVGVGSTLSFDIQGVPVELLVTSVRTVDWQTFGINFYLVVEPGALAGAPETRIAAVQLPPDNEQRIQDLIAGRFPNVTLFRIREVLEKVAAILDRLGTVVRLLGGFTVAAGIVILAGSISAGSLRRAREVALLKTLGATRRGVTSILATEYALVGLVAALIGAGGASVLARYVLIHGMEVTWQLAPARLVAGTLITVAVTVAAGLGASRRALARRPLEVLRGE